MVRTCKKKIKGGKKQWEKIEEKSKQRGKQKVPLGGWVSEK